MLDRTGQFVTQSEQEPRVGAIGGIIHALIDIHQSTQWVWRSAYSNSRVGSVDREWGGGGGEKKEGEGWRGRQDRGRWVERQKEGGQREGGQRERQTETDRETEGETERQREGASG